MIYEKFTVWKLYCSVPRQSPTESEATDIKKPGVLLKSHTYVEKSKTVPIQKIECTIRSAIGVIFYAIR